MSFGKTERWTGKFYKDGKPIYSKVAVAENIPANTEVVLDPILTNVYVDTLIDSGGMGIQYASNNTKVSIGGFSGDNIRLGIWIHNNGMSNLSNTNTIDKFEVTVEYTKTTDTAWTIPSFSN